MLNNKYFNSLWGSLNGLSCLINKSAKKSQQQDISPTSHNFVRAWSGVMVDAMRSSYCILFADQRGAADVST